MNGLSMAQYGLPWAHWRLFYPYERKRPLNHEQRKRGISCFFHIHDLIYDFSASRRNPLRSVKRSTGRTLSGRESINRIYWMSSAKNLRNYALSNSKRNGRKLFSELYPFLTCHYPGKIPRKVFSRAMFWSQLGPSFNMKSVLF